jgi:hypothetical protein
VIGSHQIEKISTSSLARWHAFDLVGASVSISLEHTPAIPPGTVNPLQARG